MKALLKYEPILFYLLILVNLFPVVFNQVVFSLDGPAHTYNAAMLKAFVTGHANGISDYFQVNALAVPNWTGHLLMTFFQFFVSPVLSEKLLVITLLVLTPVSFRYLVKSFPTAQIAGSYFIFAITYNTFQLLGFYNFLLAFIPAFYLLGCLIRNLGRMQLKHYITLSGLMIVLFLSHVFVFLLCGFVIGLIILFYIFSTPVPGIKSFFTTLWRISWPVAVAALPALILVYCFSLTKPELVPFYLDKNEVFEMFKKNQSLIGFTDDEMSMTKPLLKIFLVLSLVAFIYRCIAFWQKRRLTVHDVFPLMLVILFVLLFVLPDGDGWGGYYTLRTLMMINVFMLLWTAISHMNVWLKTGSLIAMLYFHALILMNYHSQVRMQQSMLKACRDAALKTEPGKLLLPINVTGNWIYGHTGLRAACNGCVSLENYEAFMNYFPLVWKAEVPAAPVLPNGDIPVEFGTKRWESNPRKVPVDYIFVMGDIFGSPSEGCKFVVTAIQNHYEEIYAAENCRLYKLRKDQ